MTTVSLKTNTNGGTVMFEPIYTVDDLKTVLEWEMTVLIGEDGSSYATPYPLSVFQQFLSETGLTGLTVKPPHNATLFITRDAPFRFGNALDIIELEDGYGSIHLFPTDERTMEHIMRQPYEFESILNVGVFTHLLTFIAIYDDGYDYTDWSI